MIGEKLSALLDSKKIKAGTLAGMTGIPKSTIYSIIKRNNKNVDFSVMEKIADVLDVPVEYFYDRNENNNEKKPNSESGAGQISALDIEIVNLILSLSSENREKAVSYLRFLSESECN